jgi:alpha-tubulin suppressor-like RCC1 family protein
MRLRLAALASLAIATLACEENATTFPESLADAGLLGDALVESKRCTVREITAGQQHSCALSTGGAVFCWGSNEHGELGGLATTSATPIQVSLPRAASQISAGRSRTCARLIDGSVYCWGLTPDSKDVAPVVQPPTLLALPGNAADMGAGGAHLCALTVSGGVYCAGQASSVGDGTGKGQAQPVLLPDLSKMHSVRTLTVGLFHTCALTRAGAVLCWGSDLDILAPPNTGFAPVPTLVDTIGAGVSSIVAGPNRTCVIHSDKTVSCLPTLSIETIGALGLDNSAVGPGERHTCVLKTDGKVACFGDNSLGQLGNGSDFSPSESTIQTVRLPDKAVRLAVGHAHTCIVLADRTVWCWGRGLAGQLGQGAPQSSLLPVRVLLPETCTAVPVKNLTP